jgi:hypothetical protein
MEAKKLVLAELEKGQSISYTRTILAEIAQRIRVEITTTWNHFGKENFTLRLLLEKLTVD